MFRWLTSKFFEKNLKFAGAKKPPYFQKRLFLNFNLIKFKYKTGYSIDTKVNEVKKPDFKEKFPVKKIDQNSKQEYEYGTDVESYHR